MSDGSSWPEMSAELSRKATGVLHDLVWQHGEGKIDDQALFAATKAIADTISGLVGWDVVDLINEVKESVRNER